ncbi:MAG TPA: hypothetical protein VHT25_03330 [Solirubrobacteraceae bacterium]|jgi:hypothetical protein|nr:hypothetical protein [Solirubrobacteraceae bacterium]
MLAYLSWHRAAAGVEQAAYEQSLARFHRSLAHRPPSGFRGSAALRAHELPWLAPVPGAEPDAAGYEDWYLLDDWAAVGVLEEAAVARGHEMAHHAIAARAGATTSSVYRLVEGSALPGAVPVAVWVARASGHDSPSLGALLGDGMDPQRDGLWRRCLGLGPAPEHCLLAAEAPAGVAAGRLPSGWTARAIRRELLWAG